MTTPPTTPTLTAAEYKNVSERLNSLVCAFRYIRGTFVAECGTVLDYNEPFYHAAYCIDWANRGLS